MSRSIRVLSGNLWRGRADPQGLVDLIREYGVDVFAAQELGPENAEAIASELPYGRLEPSQEVLGMGIALRRPADYQRIPLSLRDARRVLLTPSNWPELACPIDLINLHFHAPHALLPFPSWRVRAQQATDLERFLDDHPNEVRLLVGDYNATPHWPLYRRIARQFSDGALAAAQREGRTALPTWGPWSGSPRMLRIDHAMVCGLDVENFRVVPIPGSDHSALVFDCRPTSSV